MTADDLSSLSIIRTFSEFALSRTELLHERVTGLYQAHRDGVYRFLVAQGVPSAAAQEVTQDVFVKLFVALRDGVEILSEQGWLYGVAAKSAVDHWRREKNSAWVELDMSCPKEIFVSQEPSPEVLAVRIQMQQRVADALAQLPKEQRMCIQLRSEGLRYREIAEILGVAISTASEWLTIAVDRLRRAAHD